MSNNHNSNESNENDALLDQHIDALRNSSTEAGPSPQTVSATLKMLQTSRISEPQTKENRFAIGRRGFYQRLVAMTFAQRIAAAVLITIGAASLYFPFTISRSMGGSVVLADVVQKIASAHTLTCTATTTFPGKSPMTMKVLLADPDRMRNEMSGGMVSIMANHSSLLLNPRTHTATRTDFTGLGMAQSPHSNRTGIVEIFRAMDSAKGQDIGEKIIDGVAAKGFRAEEGGRPVTVWADKKTGDPVRVEILLTAGTDLNATVLSVYDHFVIDPPLDDSLFSTEAPAGYTLTTQKFDIAQLGELADNVAKLLGDFADATDGTFPASLSNLSTFTDAGAEGTKKHPEKKYNFIAEIGTITGQLYGQSPGTCGYAGKGVKLGEKDKIVFWYQPAKAKPGTYRAVFGDLHIAEVTKDQLPATQPTTLP